MNENEHPYGTPEYVKAKMEEGKRLAAEHAGQFDEGNFGYHAVKRFELAYLTGHYEAMITDLARSYEQMRKRVQELTRGHEADATTYDWAVLK